MILQTNCTCHDIAGQIRSIHQPKLKGITMDLIVFDIETAANNKAASYWASKRFEAPSNYKDEAKIKAAIEEKRHEAAKKSGLSCITGRVTAIVACRTKPYRFFGEDEAKVLSEFGNYLSERRDCQLVGKNSKIFDVPFLVGRYIAHDLGVPDQLRVIDRPRDIDECFGFSSQITRGSLSDYAWLMGIDGKLSHGSNAQAMFDETAFDPTKWDELVNYCERDVMITKEFLERYLKRFQCLRSSLPEITEVPF